MKVPGTTNDSAILQALSMCSANEVCAHDKLTVCNGAHSSKKVHLVFIAVAAPDVAAICGSVAREDCEVRVVDDPEQALPVIAAAVPDLVVCPSAAWRQWAERITDALATVAVQRPLIILLIPPPDISPQTGSSRLASESTHQQLLQSIQRFIAVVTRSRNSGRREEIGARGDIALDLITHRGTRGGHPLHLSQTTFHLLRLLMEEPERVYTREQLLRSLRGDHIHVAVRTIDAHVRRLRKELKVFGGPDVIRTVRGVGYAYSHE